MTWSFNFFLHVSAFAFGAAGLIGTFVLNRAFMRETDIGKKLQIGGIMRSLSMIAPYSLGGLLVTGIFNIYNRFGGNFVWPLEHWVLTKIVLFLIIAYNGLVVAKRLGMKRAGLLMGLLERGENDEQRKALASVDATLGRLLYIQAVLFTVIVFLSVFSSGKHPGVF